MPLDGWQRYDSPATRELEALFALHGDLRIVNMWLEDLAPVMGGPVDAAQAGITVRIKAFWDATVIALTRHYKASPRRLISSMYDKLLTELGDDYVEWFARLVRQRDRKIAHPVGHEEGHMVVVDTKHDPPRVAIDSHQHLGPSADDGNYLPEFLRALGAETEKRIKAGLSEVGREVAQLTPAQRRGLPQAERKPIGRRFGA